MDVELIDLTFLILALLYLLMSLLAGMLASIAKLVATFIAIGVALVAGEQLIPVLDGVLPLDSKYTLAIGTLLVYIVVGLFSNLLLRQLSLISAITAMGSFLSHLAGGVFGALRFFLILVFWTAMAGYLTGIGQVFSIWGETNVLKLAGRLTANMQWLVPELDNQITNDLRGLTFEPPNFQPILPRFQPPKSEDEPAEEVLNEDGVPVTDLTNGVIDSVNDSADALVEIIGSATDAAVTEPARE